MHVPLAIAIWIALAARKYRLRYALAFAMFEQESDFQAIYGHDAGGLFPGQKVTRENYRRFRTVVVGNQGGGANGVGLGQITYWTYIRDHRGLWKKRVQVFLATSILASLVHSFGEDKGVGAYNGGPTNPNMSYAEEVLARAKDIRPKLTKRGA
jgi:soluble lytic murein transglycosylase-like protein